MHMLWLDEKLPHVWNRSSDQCSHAADTHM
jgi:hypothetical protein